MRLIQNITMEFAWSAVILTEEILGFEKKKANKLVMGILHYNNKKDGYAFLLSNTNPAVFRTEHDKILLQLTKTVVKLVRRKKLAEEKKQPVMKEAKKWLK